MFLLQWNAKLIVYFNSFNCTLVPSLSLFSDIPFLMLIKKAGEYHYHGADESLPVMPRQSFTMPWFKWHLGDGMFSWIWCGGRNPVGFFWLSQHNLDQRCSTGDLRIIQWLVMIGHVWWGNQWWRILQRGPQFSEPNDMLDFPVVFKIPNYQYQRKKHASSFCSFFHLGRQQLFLMLCPWEHGSFAKRPLPLCKGSHHLVVS